MDWSKPVARFEEAVATIRALWDSGGELVNRDSKYFPLRNALFDLPPYRGTWPEIWVAAHGPRMLRITGRYADAWLPIVMVRPENYASGLEAIRSSASDAHRDPMSILPAMWFSVFTGRSRAEVDEALTAPIVKAFALNLPAEAWARHGAQHPLGTGFSGLHDFVPQILDESTVLNHVKDVPPSLLKEAFFTGTPDEIIDQAAEWRDHGVRYAVLNNISGLQPSLKPGLASALPFAKIVRGLRRL